MAQPFRLSDSCCPLTGVIQRVYNPEINLGLCLLPLLILTGTAATDDPQLTEIHSELQHIRANASQHTATRGAGPELTSVKHRLRDWIESHLVRLTSDKNENQSGKETALAVELNDEIKDAHLLCEAEEECDKNNQTALGYLGDIRLEFKQRESYLVVQTAFGVECGFDESAYLYRWSDGAWKRIWQSEQNNYTEDGYAVQTIHSVMVSPSMNKGNPLVLTLGTFPWCISNWHPVYFRLWRTNSDGSEPRVLLDQTESAYLGRHDIPILGSVGSEDALIEFTMGSIDAGLHSREAIRHFAVRGDTAERIDPVALGPRDFTEEWIANRWEQSKMWSQPSSRAALQHEHDTLHSGDVHGEFESSLHCRDNPDLWQVGLDLSENNKGMVYFFVRWQPPYRFQMVRVLHSASPSCKEKDDTADKDRTLFPIQDWREHL